MGWRGGRRREGRGREEGKERRGERKEGKGEEGGEGGRGRLIANGGNAESVRE